MKHCKTHLVRVCLFFLAVVPAYGQRGTIGVDVGETTDKFGALSSVSAAEVGVDGQVSILNSNPKTGRPAIVAGGELRIPSESNQYHAREFAFYGGARFPFRNWTFGVDGQIRKIYLPTSIVDNQFFVRYKMELFELPLSVKYTFGTGKRAYIQAQGAPEFRPRWRSNGALVVLPEPNLDHGYFVRGTVGYNFGKWYAKASYESRYFSFARDEGNPNGLYNWKSNLITGGVGLNF